MREKLDAINEFLVTSGLENSRFEKFLTINFIAILSVQDELDNLAISFPNRFSVYYVLNQVLFIIINFF